MVLLKVTSLDRVKTALKDVQGVSQDDFLSSLIAGVSQGLEDWLGIPLMSEARTEEYDVAPRTDELYLDARPVSVLTSIKTRSTRQTAWVDVTAIDAANLTLQAETGRVIIDALLYSGRQSLQAVYTAGFAASTAAFIAAYPSLAAAADAQVAHEFLRANQATQGTHSERGGVSFEQAPVDWLRVVVERWGPYRKYSLG